MRLFEIIQTTLSADLSYDASRNRLKITKQQPLKFADAYGRVIELPAASPKLKLKHLRRIKHLRKKYLEQQRLIGKLRGLMYGGHMSVKQTELETAQAELENLQAEISAEVQAAELEQNRKDELNDMAMHYVKGSTAKR